jgi:hypothetical protein
VLICLTRLFPTVCHRKCSHALAKWRVSRRAQKSQTTPHDVEDRMIASKQPSLLLPMGHQISSLPSCCRYYYRRYPSHQPQLLLVFASNAKLPQPLCCFSFLTRTSRFGGVVFQWFAEGLGVDPPPLLHCHWPHLQNLFPASPGKAEPGKKERGSHPK